MKRILKRIWNFYLDGVNEMYGPALKAGVNPFL